MEKIDFSKLTKEERNGSCENSFVHWALLHAMSTILKEKDSDDFFKAAREKPLEVELKINGRDFSFMEIMSAFDSQMDHMIAKKAESLMADKLQNLTDVSDEISSFVRATMNKAREKLGLEPSDY